ncbi:MAG: FHA domain-containing protein [Pseudomonadota bacterium]
MKFIPSFFGQKAKSPQPGDLDASAQTLAPPQADEAPIAPDGEGMPGRPSGAARFRGEAGGAVEQVNEDRKKRQRRGKTRLMGFENEAAGADPFQDATQASATTSQVKFPVGWLVVIAGPGRGEHFALSAGLSTIGRGDDQAVQLDFGDTAISRHNHAAIVFDPTDQGFVLGHGSKANIVRLNDKPLISNEAIIDGDRISLGETVLQLVTFCGETFSWDSDIDGEEDDDDMAIA